MAYRALYRAYRSQSFSEVIGQRAIVETLRNSIKNGRIAHAYLFCGPRGTGKTSVAKIFAKAVNCPHFEEEPCNTCENCEEITRGTHPDVIEMDAASHTSVDNIREIIEKVKYAPIRAPYKVYIIDEVHMLSAGAFNALLKTLEEPPAHVIFILATTDPLKIPSTIISRCQRYDFGRISDTDIAEHLAEVCEAEKISAEPNVLKMIARLSQGGMRDALSILDQCISYAGTTITADDVSSIYGLVSLDDMTELLADIRHGNTAELFRKTSEFWPKGIDVRRLTSDLMQACKDAAVYSRLKNPKLLTRLDQNAAEKITAEYNARELVQMVDLFLDTLAKYKVSESVSSYFEVALLKAVDLVGKAEEPRPVSPAENLPKTEEPAKEEKPVRPHAANSLNTPDAIRETLKAKFGVAEETLRTEPEIPEPKKENVSRETLKEPADITPDNEVMLDILVRANKEEKAVDNENFAKLPEYRGDERWGRYAGMLVGSRILASADDSLILTVQTKGVANAINSAAEDEGIDAFMEELLGTDKYLIALTRDEGNELIALFRKRHSDGTLPKNGAAMRPERAKPEKKDEPGNPEEKKNTPVDRLNALFGKGNFEIRDEER
ncbi:MAG: DNA polymerase III subunit gamma/tau [Erysipelotrichales bacterium]|nr:DNA polymerase III subunit gamma/tau [Erysipelotrichales bacterium]